MVEFYVNSKGYDALEKALKDSGVTIKPSEKVSKEALQAIKDFKEGIYSDVDKGKSLCERLGITGRGR